MPSCDEARATGDALATEVARRRSSSRIIGSMSQETALALQQEHPRPFTSASIILGRHLMDLDTDSERKARKQRVLELRLEALRKSVPEITTTNVYDVKAPTGFPREQASALVVDLAFSMPFAPYELHVSESDHS